MISDAAGIGEVVVAIVAAIMIIYQLEQEREVEQRENQIQEAGFIVQCNQIFLENEKMQYIESCLMNEDMGICTLEERWDDEMLQDCVNYLVYLEGIAPLILANIIKIETILILLFKFYRMMWVIVFRYKVFQGVLKTCFCSLFIIKC